MRTLKAILLACVAGASLLYAQSASRSGEWQTYSGDAQGRRYSPLTQINTTNVSTLKLAWQYGVAEHRSRVRRSARPAGARPSRFSCAACSTRPRRDGRSSRSIRRPAREIWKHELEKGGAPNRGVSYWPGDGRLSPRILAGTTDGRLIALDAATGQLVPTFGDHGAIDLRAGVADKYPEAAVHDGVARAHLPEPDRHRRAGAGGQLRRSGDGCPRVGCQNRQAGLDLSHDPASGRARIRHVAEGLLDDRGHAGELGLRLGRHRARPDLPAHRSAGGAVLRRPSRAAESVFLVGRRARCQHRQSPLVLSAHASRRVGLRQRGHARAHRRRPERPADSRRRHRGEVGPDVFSRARNGQADLSGRGAAGAAERHPR